jgi:hypothetical protein
MRWTLSLGLTLSLAACRQTVLIDQRPGDAGGGGGSGGRDGGGASLCSGPPLDFTPESPEIMVVLDRSAGMNGAFGNTTELAAARAALALQTARYQNVVRFGYVDFPGASPPCSPQAACCPGTVSLPSLNFEVFDNALHACDQNPLSCSLTGSQRPTAAALASCLPVFRTARAGIRRYVLLITNGRPDCGTSQNSTCMDAQTTVNQLFSDDSVKTFVVAPASSQLDQETSQCLQGIAAYGGANANFHVASDPLDLANVIGDILRARAADACELDLPSLTDPIDPNTAAVFWRGMPIP